MPECKKTCRPQELFFRFTGTDTVRGIDITRLMTAAGHLAEYLADNNKLPCETGLTEMAGFIKFLYSRESYACTEQDIQREVYIISLFYAFLKDRGCVAVNPVVQLKRQEIKKLLQGMEGRGFRSEYFREDEDE